MAPSNRPKRCGVPPPCTTARFSRARRPGVVLRVAAMRAVVPAVSATYRAVSVATPERRQRKLRPCLLYTSDAADDLLCVDLGGRRIIKKKKKINKRKKSTT